MNGFYCILTYGCQMNENDSEKMAGQLASQGYLATDNLEEADVIVINTCCVRESAEKKIYGKIGELKRHKQERPHVRIIITGCMAQKDKERILRKASHVDLVMGTNMIHHLAAWLGEQRTGERSVLAEAETQIVEEMPVVRKSGVAAWVPIMFGCNNFCTYCIVPYVRGRERSRALSDIVDEVRSLAAEGYQEITLLGQNVNSYGKGTPDTFAALLQALDDIPGLLRIRYMTSHPRDMDDAVIAAVAKSKHITTHFHLPIQAGNNEILRQMNRGYTREEYLELVRKVRAAVPDAVLTTDLIVGFPGETEEMFADTVALVEEVGFDASYTFLYSSRSGTPAAEMKEQVPLAVKKERLQRLLTSQEKVALACNEKLLHTCQEILVEGPSKTNPKQWCGRTRGNKLVLWPYQEGQKPGDLIQVRIIKAQTWILKGESV